MRRLFTLFLLALFLTPSLRAQVVFSSNFDHIGGLVLEKYFSDNSLTSGNWSTYDVTGAQSWQTGNFSGTNPYAEMNGYDGGANENEDWYISPSLDASQGLYLEFMNAMNFSGPDLLLQVSTDYDGSSAPSTANWDTISYDKSQGGFDWVNSGSIDLTNYSDPDLYIAFVYHSTNSAAAHWEVDDIRISTEPLDWFGSKTNIETDSLEAFTADVNYGTYGARMINEDSAHRRLTTKPLQVDVGETYEVSYWVRGGSDVRAGLYDGHTSDGDFGYSYAEWENIDDDGQWQKITQTLTADTTNPNAEFILSVSLTDPSLGHAKFDSVVVEGDDPNSIADLEKAQGELNAFPNPSEDVLHVRTKGYGMDLTIDLIDRTGRIVRSSSNSASTQTDFDVEGLDAGVYFLRIRNEKYVDQKKVVVR